MITSTYDERITASLPEIQDRISEAAQRSGRGSDEVTLVAVTKAHPIEAVQAALSHGLFDLGRIGRRSSRGSTRPWRTGGPSGI